MTEHQHAYGFDSVVVPPILPELIIVTRCDCGHVRHFPVEELGDWAKRVREARKPPD